MSTEAISVHMFSIIRYPIVPILTLIFSGIGAYKILRGWFPRLFVCDAFFAGNENDYSLRAKIVNLSDVLIHIKSIDLENKIIGVVSIGSICEESGLKAISFLESNKPKQINILFRQPNPINKNLLKLQGHAEFTLIVYLSNRRWFNKIKISFKANIPAVRKKPE